MNTRSLIFRITVLAFVLATAALPLAAWDYDTCLGSKIVWGSNVQDFRAANISFPFGPVRNALDAAGNAWNQAPASKFRFAIYYEDFSSQVMPNWSNEIIFSNSLDWNTLGVTSYWTATCFHITEKDIRFNAQRSWSFDLSPLNLQTGEPFSFPLVAIHELGHGLGLNHQTWEVGTMSAYYPNGGPVGNLYQQHFQPLPDDVEGARAGYGTCCAIRDVVASAYAVNSANQTNPIVPPSIAFRGRSTGFRFTVGNRGSVDESSVRVHFFLSTDRFIDSSDYFVGSTILSINHGGMFKGTTYITVPVGFPPGYYFFGYVVDPYNEIYGEADELNNAVAVGSQTYVPPYTPPSACFTANPSSAVAPAHITFDGSCSSDPDGWITNYQWTVDDGRSANGQVVDIFFPEPGNWRVTLTVTDNEGYTSSTENWVWIQDPSGCLQCF
jgi:hypothetical protein